MLINGVEMFFLNFQLNKDGAGNCSGIWRRFSVRKKSLLWKFQWNAKISGVVSKLLEIPPLMRAFQGDTSILECGGKIPKRDV